MTKRIIMLAALGAALLSCRQEEAPVPAPQEPVRIIAEDADPVRVSYGEAVSELEAMLEAMEPGPKTKGAGRRIGKMEAVTAGMRTRAGNLPDTLLYVVDLEGGEGGYAVMSALRGMPSTLVIADQGQGDAGRLSRMISDTPTEADLADESSFADGLVADYVRSLIVPDSVPLSGEIELITPFPGGAYGMWKTVKQKGPMILTKWHQGHPFNYMMDYSKAGCGPVAIAQLMAYYEYPETLKKQDGSIFRPNWTLFKTVASCSNPNGVVPSYLLEPIGTLCMIIAHDSGQWWDANDGKGYTTIAGLAQAMNKYGWMNCRPIQGYPTEQVEAYLLRDKPCCIDASSSTSNGRHSFLLDGLKRYERNVYKTVYKKGNILDHVESRVYIHCNFGWNGKKDGWFNHAVFDADSGPIEKEPDVDFSLTNVEGLDKGKYDHNFYFLYYN